MQVHVLVPEEVTAIEEALDEIKEATHAINVEGNELNASLCVRILSAQDRIRYRFATWYYIFRCIDCGQLHSAEEHDLKLMLKACGNRGCEAVAGNTLVFVDKTTVAPPGTITRGTF